MIRNTSSTEAEVAQVANECAAYIGAEAQFRQEDIKVVYGYKGEGYGVVGDLERESIGLMARSRGLFLIQFMPDALLERSWI